MERINRFRIKFGMTGRTRHAELVSASIAAILSAFMFFGCDQLQDSLSSEQQEEMDENIGYAYLDGTTWYYDGISTTDFSSTEGAALAVNFTKKVEMAGTRTLEDNGTYSYDYDLSGSFTVNYTSTTGQTSSVVTEITAGKIILDTNDEESSVSAGTLSADGKIFRLNMTPICKLLDANTLAGNAIDGVNTVEIKLQSGFVCAEGDQKGRTLPKFDKKIMVKPLYEDETITKGVIFSSASSTAGKYITIPTNGSVSFADGAAVAFATDDDSISLTSNNFSLITSGNSLSVLCDVDLINKDFIGKFTISGFVPELNASSYTRTFTVDITPQLVTLDGILDEEAWTTAAVSEDSYANPANYNLTKLSVTNDSSYLYVAVEGNVSFNTNDRIILMIDNQSATDAGKASTDDHDSDNYYGPATKATYSSVDFYLCHILSTPEMQDYQWVSSSGRSDGVETSATSTSESVIEYKIPLSIIASAATGNMLKVFVTTTSYAWTTINETTLQDCIPAAAATVSDNGQTVTIDFANALDYTVKSSE